VYPALLGLGAIHLAFPADIVLEFSARMPMTSLPVVSIVGSSTTLKATPLSVNSEDAVEIRRRAR
jgi:hypothetical protein